MKFSIVIPAYNCRKLLRNTLEVLNDQTESDFEVVVVDDGSTDDTRNYIKGAARSYELKYLYLERNEDSCRARTRNHGWKNSTGDFIAFIDSDILVKPDYVGELKRCFSINEDIAIVGYRLFMDEPANTGNFISGEIFSKYSFKAENIGILEFRYLMMQDSSFNAGAVLRPWSQVYSCNLAVPRKWLELTGGFDENFKGWGMEDVELGYSLYKNGINIVFDSKLEGLHQYHGPRSDLIITKDKIHSYNRNIGYFLIKHPEATGLSEENSYKYFRGEAFGENKTPEKEDLKYLSVDFRDKERLESVKALVLSLSKRGYLITVLDYVEDTGLDIWVQLLPREGMNAVRYFPMSKKIDPDLAMDFLGKEGERQIKANDVTGTSTLQTTYGNNWERTIVWSQEEVPSRENFRYSWVKKNIIGNKILEIGCSSGFGTSYFRDIEGLDYLGIDYSRRVIDLANQEFGEKGRIRFECHEIHSYLEFLKKHNARFDSIIALEVLEHLSDGLDVAQKLKGFCDKLLITMPFNERKGYWGEWHLLNGIREKDLPGFRIVFLHNNGTVSEKPSYSEGDLMLADWSK